MKRRPRKPSQVFFYFLPFIVLTLLFVSVALFAWWLNQGVTVYPTGGGH